VWAARASISSSFHPVFLHQSERHLEAGASAEAAVPPPPPRLLLYYSSFCAYKSHASVALNYSPPTPPPPGLAEERASLGTSRASVLSMLQGLSLTPRLGSLRQITWSGKPGGRREGACDEGCNGCDAPCGGHVTTVAEGITSIAADEGSTRPFNMRVRGGAKDAAWALIGGLVRRGGL